MSNLNDEDNHKKKVDPLKKGDEIIPLIEQLRDNHNKALALGLRDSHTTPKEEKSQSTFNQ